MKQEEKYNKEINNNGLEDALPDNLTIMDDQPVDKEYEKYIRETNENSIRSDARSIAGIVIGSVICALNLGLFVRRGNLTPGGITGITVIAQRLALKFAGISIPFAPISIALNLLAAAFAFKTLGKKYVGFSFISILISSILTDFVPEMALTDDRLLIAVFGGIISATGASLVLKSGACTGGSDFIAMTFSVKKGINTFGYVLMFNICLILISGIFFSFEDALYTIIYQYVSTQMLRFLYQRYEKKTLLIVTSAPGQVAHEIRVRTNHTCTIFEGTGGFTGHTNHMVYMVVGADELNLVRKTIKTVDRDAFINVLDSSMVTGNFYIKSLR